MIGVQFHLLSGGVQPRLGHGVGGLREQGLEGGQVLRLEGRHVARLPRTAVATRPAFTFIRKMLSYIDKFIKIKY